MKKSFLRLFGLLLCALAGAQAHAVSIPMDQQLRCTAGFYDRFNDRHVTTHDLTVYGDFSFSLTGESVYLKEIEGWGTDVGANTIAFQQNIGFGRDAALGTLTLNSDLSQGEFKVAGNSRRATLVCKLEPIS